MLDRPPDEAGAHLDLTPPPAPRGVLAWWHAALGRTLLVLWLVWALTPATTMLVGWSLFLPGEAWGYFFLVAGVGFPAWGVLGLGLVATGLVRRGRAVLPTLVSLSVALALAYVSVLAARHVPLDWTLAPAARRRFERDVVTGEWMKVPGDQYYSGCGYYVRELGGASEAPVATLAFEGHTLVVPRGQTSSHGRSVTAGLHGDLALVVPLRDGWWYVYVDY